MKSKTYSRRIWTDKDVARRRKFLRRRDTYKILCFKPSQKGMSAATAIVRVLNHNHPGVTVFYHVASFLADMDLNELNFDRMYVEAIKHVPMKEVFGRVHYTPTSRTIVKGIEDLERMMLECLRASDISDLTGKEFLFQAMVKSHIC